MKKIVFALFLLFSFCNSYSQITYTPQTAAGYQFKYVKSDSGFALPFIDTSLRRGVNRIGAVVARPQDSLLYYWTGAKWSKINADVSGLISLINSKVDSVTVYGNDLKYWINGVAVQYSLNTYLGNLQTVTNNGNTTTNDIQVNRLQANAAITATQINASDYLFRTLTNNAFADSLRGYIKGDSLTHNNLNWYLPDTTGTFVLRINGVAPDKNGNVTGLFGGGSGSLDTTTIYNNLALKLNIADTADMLNAYVNDAYNGLQKLGQKIGLGGTLNQHTTIDGDGGLRRFIIENPQYFRVNTTAGGTLGVTSSGIDATVSTINLTPTDSIIINNLSTNINTNYLIGGKDVNGRVTKVNLGSGLALSGGVLYNSAPLGTDTATITGFGLTKNITGNSQYLEVDSAAVATQHKLNLTDAQVAANTAAITQRVTYANLIDSLNNLSLSKTGDTITLNVNGRQFKVKDSVGTGGGGSITLAAIGSTPNANGATISGSDLTLQPADSTYGGVLSTVSQKIRGEKTFTDNVSINNNKLFINSIAGNGPPLIEFTRRDILGNITGKGAYGYGGSNELNDFLNLDYTLGTHKYYDSTKPALWTYMYALPGGNTSWGLQWVKESHTNSNIYNLYGKEIFRIDNIPHTSTGEAVQGGTRLLTQQVDLVDGAYINSTPARLKYSDHYFEVTGATEIGLAALRIAKGGSPTFDNDAIATYKTTGGNNKFYYLNNDNADNYHWNVYDKFQGGTNRDLGGAGKYYLRNWASAGMMDWGLRSQANLFNGSSSKLDYYFATLDGDFVTRDKMVLSYDGSLTINNLASGYVKSTSGLLSSSTAIPQADVTNLTTDLAAKLSNITGLITQGTNVTITGSGTSGSPYVINASGGGGGGLNYSQVKAIANK